MPHPNEHRFTIKNTVRNIDLTNMLGMSTPKVNSENGHNKCDTVICHNTDESEKYYLENILKQ